MKPGTSFAAVNAPAEHTRLVAGGTSPAGAAVVIVYLKNAAEVRAEVPELKKMLAPDARLWIAYPKAKKLGTDLNRDVLCALLADRGFEPVRLVAIDETWSAMWFKRVSRG